MTWLLAAALPALAAGVWFGRYTLRARVAQRDADVKVLEHELVSARKERDEARESLVLSAQRIDRLTRAHDDMAGRLADAEKRAAAAIAPGDGAKALAEAFK